MKKYALFLFTLFFHFCFADEKKPLYYIDPMEPNIHYDKPGKSRMGMDVVPVFAEDQQGDKPIIQIDPAVVNNLGVRTAPVELGSFNQTIRAVGYVQPDENFIQHVHTYAEGWIKKMQVKTLGQTVQSKALLFQYFSPTLVAAQEEYLIALKSHDPVMIRASEKKLLALGVSQSQIDRIKKEHKTSELIDVFAEQGGGVVTELNVREGMRVTPELDVMSISHLQSIWILVEIYEAQAARVKVDQIAEATVNAYPSKIWRGKVEYIYPELSPNTRTLKVRLRFDNPDEQLKPNMFANVRILAEPKNNVLMIPTEALIRTQENNRVIISLGNGKFEPRLVKLGMETDGKIEITSGLKPGEQVVTSAQFLIDSEASLKGALNRLSEEPKPAMQHHHHGHH